MHFVEAPRDGALAVQVEVEDAALREKLRSPSPPEWRLTIDVGAARVTKAERILGAGQPLVTLLAVDQSGSFRPYRPQAWKIAEHYVLKRLEGERIGIVLFGLEAVDLPTYRRHKDIRAQLIKASRSSLEQRETGLDQFIRHATERASRENPSSEGGIRQVIVFTDGGEESATWKVDDLVAHARSLFVRIHVVAFYKSSKGILAQRLDDMNRLAAETGGVYAQVEDQAAALGGIERIVLANQHIYRVHATQCGVVHPAGLVRFEDHLAVAIHDGSSALGWADPAPFEQVASGAAATPCSAVLPPSSSPPTTAVPATNITPPPGFAAWTAESPRSRWAWLGTSLLLAAILIALIVRVLLLTASRRTGDPREETSEVPPTIPPAPSREHAPNPPRASESPMAWEALVGPPEASADKPAFSSNLPETHLVVVEGDVPQGSRWQFRGRILRVGASEDDNDVIIDLPQVSGMHARFELYPSGSVFVTDQDSRHGTWVDGRRIRADERVEVKPGQRVALSKQLVIKIEQPGRTE